tara:strand:- start:350 stop:664 length:315 start_codon:yes stop_codon:yes gene_type:complete
MKKMTAKKREQAAQKLIDKVYLNQHEKLSGMDHLQEAYEGLRDMITFRALLDLGLMPVDIPHLLSEVEDKHREAFEKSHANFDAILRWQEMHNTLANKDAGWQR